MTTGHQLDTTRCDQHVAGLALKLARKLQDEHRPRLIARTMQSWPVRRPLLPHTQWL